MMTHEDRAVSTEELVDFLTDALIDSTGPDWTCSDGAWAIARQLAQEGRLDRVLEAFDPPAQQFRAGASIYDGMRGSIEVRDEAGFDGWRTIAHCWQWNEAKFVARALNAYAASVDTLPKGGDAKQAPCESKGSAVTPKAADAQDTAQ